MTKKSRSRSNKVRVPNDRNSRRRKAEALALRRPLIPQQADLGLHIRYCGLTFRKHILGDLWVTAHMDTSWELGNKLSVLRFPVPKQYSEEGWDYLQYTWRIRSELHQLTGDPVYLVANPISDAEVRFDSFPSRKYNEGREIVFIDLVEAHEKSRSDGFLKIHVRGREVALFRVEVKTEDRETGTILVRYVVKSRAQPTP